MNPSNLPPQGRYSDDRLKQMVLDALDGQGVTPEKFYFTSDDWMVSYDGPTPAWNSVFGIAAYRKDGGTFYAECGVSQRYDAASSQWGEPAATVKTGLPLSEEAFRAAPSTLGGALGADASSTGEGTGRAAPDSSQTIAAGAIPGLPGTEYSSEPQSEFPSGEEWSDAERADGRPRVVPGPGHEWHHTDREPEPEREPVPSGEEWSSAEPAAARSAGSAGPDEDEEADLRQAGDLGVDESALAGAGAVAGAAAATGGSGTVTETPSYESAGAEAEAREHPDGGHHAHVAGYALRVKQDGTAELQVPLGGQVTLRWAGQTS